MKTRTPFTGTTVPILAALAWPYLASAAIHDYRVVERGSDFNVMQSVRTVTDITGQTSFVTNRYTTLGNGLNRKDTSGNWVECMPVARSYPGGIVCTGATYRVILKANLNQQGSVDFETSDGHRIVSHPLALAYFDPVDVRRVWIAQVKDCEGVVTSNKVVYADAFAGEGIEAAVVYDYGLSFHQNVVFTRRPGVTPADFGMGSKARLEVVTEIVQAPTPTVKPRTLSRERDAAMRAQMLEPDLIDETLWFGEEMKMTRGFAFPNFVTDRRARFRFPVAKRLRSMSGGRTVLTESLLWEDVRSELSQLPEMARITPSTNDQPMLVELPAQPRPDDVLQETFADRLEEVTRTDVTEMALASVNEPAGFVVDYTILQSSSQTWFPGGTYFIPEYYVELEGPCEFGQCIFKFEEGECPGPMGELATFGPVSCMATQMQRVGRG